MSIPVLIVAGEKSGEEHALTFVDSIKNNSKDSIDFFGVGGDALEKKGMKNFYHVKDFSFIGFSGILSAYPYYKKALNHLLREVEKTKCQNAILIDFQTFNLKLAKELNKRGIRVFYYVAPQAWAWKEWRVKILAKVTFSLFTILGFEKEWFTKRGVKNVISVPHPILRKYKGLIPENLGEHNDEVLFLPGSRNSEVKDILPVFAQIAEKLKKEDIKCSIVISESVNKNLYKMFSDSFDIFYDSENIATAMTKAKFSFAASGTVTLSLALFCVPSIVCYRVSLFNEFILRSIVKRKGMVSLANIVHQEIVFPEYLQDEMQTSSLIRKYREMILPDHYSELIEKLKETKSLLAAGEDDVGLYIAKNLKI